MLTFEGGLNLKKIEAVGFVTVTLHKPKWLKLSSKYWNPMFLCPGKAEFVFYLGQF